jgi:hypothetical protein
MKPIIRNTGQTPAYNVKYRSRAAILTFPLAQDFVFPLASSVAMASTTVIGADQTNFMLITTESMYGPSEVASIKEPVDKSNMRLVVYGTVDYTDAFNRPRYTNFCFFVEWSGPSLPEMLNHIRHNEAN